MLDADKLDADNLTMDHAIQLKRQRIKAVRINIYVFFLFALVTLGFSHSTNFYCTILYTCDSKETTSTKLPALLQA